MNQDLETTINSLISVHLANSLDWVQVIAPADKFAFIRTKILNEFGDKGLRSELQELFKTMDWNGVGGNTHTGKEVT
jgi:hypothetical protein